MGSHDLLGVREIDQLDSGASAVEYGLLVFAIAAVIAAVVFAFGMVVEDTYAGTCEDFADSANATQTC